MGGGGGGRLFEAGRLLTFSAFRMGAYSRWALIRGWALIRINTVFHRLSKITAIVNNFALQSTLTGNLKLPSLSCKTERIHLVFIFLQIASLKA